MTKLLLGQIIKKRGISKRQLAKMLGETYSNIFRYFREGYDPKLSTLRKWAKVLNCKVRDLFEE